MCVQYSACASAFLTRAEVLARRGELEAQVPDARAHAPAGGEGGQVDRLVAPRVPLVPLHDRRARGPRRHLAGTALPAPPLPSPHLLSPASRSRVVRAPLPSRVPAARLDTIRHRMRTEISLRAEHRGRGARADQRRRPTRAAGHGAREGELVREGHNSPGHGEATRRHEPPHTRFAPPLLT